MHSLLNYLAACVLLATTVPAYALAETYYVDSSGGNDSNDGRSELAPWRSINRVNSHNFRPGDTILFRRGREWYDVSIKVYTPDLRIASYGSGPLPRLIGARELSDWNVLENGVHRADARQDWGVELLVEDGQIFYDRGFSLEKGLPTGTFFFDKRFRTIYFKPSPDIESGRRSFLVGSQNHIIELQNIQIARLVIDSLEISYANRYGVSPWWQGAPIKHGTIEISNCLFVGNAFSAIAFSGNATYEQIFIHDNVILKNGAEGIYIGPDAIRSRLHIADNKIGDLADTAFGWRGEGPQSAFVGDGIDVKQGNRGVVIERNAITNLKGGYGIGILSGGALVQENIVRDIYIPDGAASGIYIDVGDGLGLTTVRANKIFGSKSYGVVIRGSARIHPPVLVEDNEISLSMDNPFSQFGLTSRNKENITIRRNQGEGGAYGIYLYGDTPRGVVIEDNALLNTRTVWWIDPRRLDGLAVRRNAVCSGNSAIIEWANGDRIRDARDAKQILGGADSLVEMPCTHSGGSSPARPEGVQVK